MAFGPPAIPEIGPSAGVTFMLQDRAGKDVAFLAEQVMTFMTAAGQRKELAGVIPLFSPAVPQVFVDVDREKVLKKDLELSAVYQTLQTFMGSYFVNYFNRFGRQWQVFVQAEGDYRQNAEQIGQFYVKNNGGHGPVERGRKCESDQRARVHHALQPLSLGANHGRPGARLFHRAGHESDGGSLRRDHA